MMLTTCASDNDLMCAMEQRLAYAVFERLKMMVNLMGTKGINGRSSLTNRFKVCF